MPMRIVRRLRNISRINEVFQIAVRYGFRQWVDQVRQKRRTSRTHVRVELEDTDPTLKGKSAGERLRLLLQTLGPTYVKIGQLLATRNDLLPTWATVELSKLQDQVPPFPLGTARQIIEAELGAPLEQVFSDFSPEPLGSASLGQVHRAVLNRTGQAVAVKVQRPGIDQVVERDLSVVMDLVELLERHRIGGQHLNLRQAAEELAEQLRDELNYTVEARNAERASQALPADSGVRIPAIHWAATTDRVLTTELFEGIKLTEPDRVPPEARPGLARTLIRFTLHQVLADGFYHADLHPGNLYVLPDGPLGVIDWGQVGLLSRRMRDALDEIFVAMATRDSERLTDEVVRMGLSSEGPEVDAFRYDLNRALDRYLHAPRSENTMGSVLRRILDLSYEHSVRLPSELPSLVKVLAAAEGTCLKLDPQFDLRAELQPLARRIVGRQLNPEQLARTTLANARQVSRIANDLPRQLANLFERIDTGALVLKIDTDLDGPGRYLALVVNRMSFAAITCGFMVAGALAMTAWPAVGKTVFACGVVMALASMYTIARRTKE